MSKPKAFFRAQYSKHRMDQSAVAMNKLMLQAFLTATAQHDMACEDLATLADDSAVRMVGVVGSRRCENILGFCVRMHRDFRRFTTHARAVGVVAFEHLCAMERILRRDCDPEGLPAHRIEQ